MNTQILDDLRNVTKKINQIQSAVSELVEALSKLDQDTFPSKLSPSDSYMIEEIIMLTAELPSWLEELESQNHAVKNITKTLEG